MRDIISEFPMTPPHPLGDGPSYLVIAWARAGRYWAEANCEDCDRKSVLWALMAGEWGGVESIIEVNVSESTSRDVSEDFARDLVAAWRDERPGEPLPRWAKEFVHRHAGAEVTRGMEGR